MAKPLLFLEATKLCDCRENPRSNCRGPLNLSPWLYVIPLELAPFKELLAALGVPPSFTAQQFCQVGFMLKRNRRANAAGNGAHTARAPSMLTTIPFVQVLASMSEQNDKQPLSEQHLEQALAIISALAGEAPC